MATQRHTSPALLTDLYELTMAQVEHRLGTAGQPASFSLFVRRLPPGRGCLVAAGLEDCLTWLEDLSFTDDDLAVLDSLGHFDDDFLAWLGKQRFEGDVRAVPEGTPVLAGEPILEVDAPFAVAQLAETYLLNQITLQTVLATKAARCVTAAEGRAVVDFALRRTPGTDAAMKLARVGALVGLAGTSNVAGAARYGLDASGTMAHSFVQAHTDETQAFRDFVSVYGDDSVLLVDTYDTATGVARAVQVALERSQSGGTIRGIRLDSGDLAALSREARAMLDAAGLDEVSIFASGSLDEYEIHRLLASEDAPIDAFGVGTALGTSSDAPSIDSVYKLVELDGRGVRKTSASKATLPGRKQLWRHPDWPAVADVLATADESPPADDYRPLLEPVMLNGTRTAAGTRPFDDTARRARRTLAQLAPEMTALTDPLVPEAKLSPGLAQLTEQVDRERQLSAEEDP